VIGGALALLALAGLLAWRRVRRRDRPDPQRLRALAAAGAFRARIDDPAASVADALAEYLAAHLRCPPAAVIAPELPGRLRAAGVPADLARRTGQLLEDLVGARYGGEHDGEGAAAEARALVDELEIPFLRTEPEARR
jgi:hypothetical protein